MGFLEITCLVDGSVEKIPLEKIYYIEPFKSFDSTGFKIFTKGTDSIECERLLTGVSLKVVGG